MFPSAHAWRNRTNATASRKPRAPTETTVAGTASTNASGSPISIPIPKTNRPQSSVAIML